MGGGGRGSGGLSCRPSVPSSLSTASVALSTVNSRSPELLIKVPFSAENAMSTHRTVPSVSPGDPPADSKISHGNIVSPSAHSSNPRAWPRCLAPMPGARAWPRSGENLQYSFKGALRAPDAGLVPLLESDVCRMCLLESGATPADTGRTLRGAVRAGRRLPLLGPAGPRRRRRASCPRGPRHRLGAATISARRAICKSGPSSRRSSVQPGRDHPQGRFASHVMAYGHSPLGLRSRRTTSSPHILVAA
jgi:hypothetical protein